MMVEVAYGGGGGGSEVEAVVQALNTIIQLHFEKMLEKKRVADGQKKELWHLFQLFFLFLALVLGAQLGALLEWLQCRHCWGPIGLLSLGHLIFYITVAQTLHCLNGFKYQHRCNKLTLALATDRLKHLKMRYSSITAGDHFLLLPMDYDIPYQEPLENVGPIHLVVALLSALQLENLNTE